MPMRNTSLAYGTVHRALHWTLAAMVLAQLAIGDAMLFALPQNTPGLTSYVHPTLGILIGLLMLARLIWRERNQLPVEPKDTGLFGQTLSTLTHVSFYFLLILNPIIGYLLICAMGDHAYFIVAELPHVTGASVSLGTLFFWLHLGFGVGIGGLFLLHAFAALNHEFLLRDNVLRRMLGFPRMTRAREERQERWPVNSPAAEVDMSPTGLHRP